MATERFSQSYRDAQALLGMAVKYSGIGTGASSLEKANEWFHLDSDLKYSKSMAKEGVHAVVLNHIYLDTCAKLASSPVLTFIAIVESGTTVTTALKKAAVWAIEGRYKLRHDRRECCENALRSIYEFTDNHKTALDKLLSID